MENLSKKTRKAKKALQKTAVTFGVSEAEVRAELQSAIAAAMRDPDPTVRAFWATLSPDGTPPSPESIIQELAFRLKRQHCV